MFRDRYVLSGWRRGTLALMAGLALGGCATAPAPTTPQWVAVSVLSPVAVDPATPWFPRAASLALRNELAAIPGLMVVVAPAAVPDQAQWIVGGTVSRGSAGTRFDVTLRRKAETAPSWQRRFEYGPEGDASQWRRDIPAAVAAQIGAQAKPAAAADWGGCRSGPAADDTLRAIEAYGSYRTRDDLMRVRASLEQALKHEPGCSEAQAQFAMTHVSELGNQWGADARALAALADRLSRETVAANRQQPMGHMARVQLLRLQGQVAAAVEAATLMTQLDPSNGLFMGRLAALQFDAGNAAATLAAARKVKTLAQGTPAALQQGLLFEALGLYSMEQEEQAVVALRQLVALNAQNMFAWRLLAGIEAVQGRDAEAAEALRRFIALAPPGQTIKRLRANETTVTDAQFLRQRERYYAGLRRAGLPE